MRPARSCLEAIFAASSPDGSLSSLASSLCESARLWSEPAAPTQSHWVPPAGIVIWYCSSPPLPRPKGPSLHWLGIGSVRLPGQTISPSVSCGPRNESPVSWPSGVTVEATSAE